MEKYFRVSRIDSNSIVDKSIEHIEEMCKVLQHECFALFRIQGQIFREFCEVQLFNVAERTEFSFGNTNYLREKSGLLQRSDDRKNHIEKQPSIVDDHNLRAERQTEGPAFGIDEFMRILSEPRTEDKGPLNILLEVRDKLQPQLILLGPRRYWQIILTPFFGTTLGRWT